MWIQNYFSYILSISSELYKKWIVFSKRLISCKLPHVFYVHCVFGIIVWNKQFSGRHSMLNVVWSYFSYWCNGYTIAYHCCILYISLDPVRLTSIWRTQKKEGSSRRNLVLFGLRYLLSFFIFFYEGSFSWGEFFYIFFMRGVQNQSC